MLFIFTRKIAWFWIPSFRRTPICFSIKKYFKYVFRLPTHYSTKLSFQ